MKWFLLISTLSVIYCRPQNIQNEGNHAAVEIEKQDVVEINPKQLLHKNLEDILPTNLQKKNVPKQHEHEQRKVEQKTKEILEKIEALNKKQGLTPKRSKPNYFQFPFTYSRSQENQNNILNQKLPQNQNTNNNFREATDFKFSRNPLANPILDYIEQDNNQQQQNYENYLKYSMSPSDRQPMRGFGMGMVNPTAEVSENDNIPGQYIKRKVTHFQSIILPNPLSNGYQTYPALVPPMSNYQTLPSSASMMSQVPYMQSMPQIQNVQSMGQFQNIPSPIQQSVPYLLNIVNGQAYENQPNLPQGHQDINNNITESKNKTLNTLEKETIDNIKNIVGNSQPQYVPIYFNPYSQNSQMSVPQPIQQRDINGYSPYAQNNYDVYAPYGMPYNPKPYIRPRQQVTWPFAQFFPIVIKDPFHQMMNAFTSMIEYGQGGGGAPNAGCRKDLPLGDNDVVESRIADDSINKLQYKIENTNNNPEITIYGVGEGLNPENATFLDIENLEISGNKNNNNMQIVMGIKGPLTQERESKDTKSQIKSNTLSENNKRGLSKLGKVTPESNMSWIKLVSSTISPPIRGPELEDDELEDDTVDKAEDIQVSHDGNKKLFSKDNTGSGIFIHKLKVRKGGVAIAGPGGIATAGSGGTAIVGPNGVAYTHPDSLAIAGSGTKVVAVDPTINLGDLINSQHANHGKFNETNLRVGKVVAVGPVIYYNKG